MVSQFKALSRGFHLVFVGTLLVVGSIIGMFVGMLFGVGLAGAGGGLGALGFTAVLIVAMALLGLAGRLTFLVGSFFCLATPEKAGSARTLIMISVILQVLAIALSVFQNVTDFVGFMPAMMRAGLGMAVLLSVPASGVLFLLYIRSLAKFIQRIDLGDMAMLVLWLCLSVIGIQIVGFVVILMGGAAGVVGGRGGAAGMVGLTCVGMLIFLVALVVGVVALIRFIALVKEMRDATAAFARRVRSRRVKRPPQKVFEEEDFDDDRDDDQYDDRDEPDDEDDEDDDDDDDDDHKRQRRTYLDR